MSRFALHPRSLSTAAALTAIFALAACNPFRNPMRQDPVVQINAHDTNVNSRWNGTLASPSDLAGAVQMKGAASMSPGVRTTDTRVALDLSNATPGGVHPWQIHAGQCGSDMGVFGSASDYPLLRVNDNGTASVHGTVATEMPSQGNYFVSVGASSANPETIVACGNLAPPSR